jgi:hypothetical protein
LVDAETALSVLEPDQSALAALITAMTEFVDFWRAVGLYAYQTHYDCVLGKLLAAADRHDEARARIETGLRIAADTGMHFHDAELLRARAHTHGDDDSRAADLAAAIESARRQDMPLFQLRAAIDAFELRGDAARADLVAAAARLPAGSGLREVTRARALLS